MKAMLPPERRAIDGSLSLPDFTLTITLEYEAIPKVLRMIANRDDLSRSKSRYKKIYTSELYRRAHRRQPFCRATISRAIRAFCAAVTQCGLYSGWSLRRMMVSTMSLFTLAVAGQVSSCRASVALAKRPRPYDST